MDAADLIPDRRRNHFPLNGGPRPTEADKERGHRGVDAARKVLEEETPPPLALPWVVHPLGPEATRRARAGIDAARHALEHGDEPYEVSEFDVSEFDELSPPTG